MSVSTSKPIQHRKRSINSFYQKDQKNVAVYVKNKLTPSSCCSSYFYIEAALYTVVPPFPFLLSVLQNIDGCYKNDVKCG